MFYVVRCRLPLLALVSGVTVAAVAPGCSPQPMSNSFPTRDVEVQAPKDSGPSKPRSPEEEPALPEGGALSGAVYAHTATSLYLFEPIRKALTKVGDFACLDRGDRVLDIAVDRDGVMYATSDFGFLSINVTNATCTYVRRAGRYPNSLSFVPLGTVDPTKEALVGYQFDTVAGNHVDQATRYVRIDVVDGSITKLGELNDPAAPIKYKSSGDMIALVRRGNRAYLTVKLLDADSETGNDYLAEVDPSTGRITSVLGDIEKTDLFGLGFWAGKGYGFSASGEILELDMTNGASTVVTTLMQDGRPVPWYGAGVKTTAPVTP